MDHTAMKSEVLTGLEITENKSYYQFKLVKSQVIIDDDP